MKWKAPSIPYHCDPSLLPAPFPTTADIENASCLLVERSCKVVRIGEHFIAKFGPQKRRRIIEGLNLIFVNQNLPSLSTPLVYGLYEENENAYLVMQRLAGQSLEDLWLTLQPGEIQMIFNKLKRILDDMRSLPPPPFYGSVDYGPVPYFLFWTPTAQKEINGPFTNEKDFYLGLVEKLHGILVENNQNLSRIDWLRKHLPGSLEGHPPTFTHGDILKKNILVERIVSKGTDSKENDFRVTLLDWEDSGWYPNYFEYFSCYTRFCWDDDWPQLIETFLEPFPLETMMLVPVYHEIFL